MNYLNDEFMDLPVSKSIELCYLLSIYVFIYQLFCDAGNLKT